MLALMSGDEKMIGAYKDGKDLYATVACSVFGNMRIDEILSQEYYPPIKDLEEEYWNIEFKHAGQYFHYKN